MIAEGVDEQWATVKVAIASLGRFHVLDLAREIDRLGVDTRFYSYVPRKRAVEFGLPGRCHVGLLPFVAPLVLWQMRARKVLPQLQERAMAHALDAAVTAWLQPCDVFICMSGMYLGAARHAKARYGAKVWLERGSRHILSQREILAALDGAQGPSDFIVARELAGYEMADRIVVASTHVAESFREKAPHLAAKLFVNPYGVDLDHFPARTSLPPAQPRTVIFVGGWSRRKGCDVLVEAIRKLKGVRLLHVGGIVDLPFPHDDPRFEHVDPVPQWRLKDYYGRAHVFALASREDGFGMVLSQALATGLPLVCTTMTGGRDLALSPALASRIRIVAPDDARSLADAFVSILAQVTGENAFNSLEESDRQLLSWRAYGRRYYEELVGR